MPSSEPNFDAKMVDWLYDELDPAEAKSFEKHLEDNPAAQAEADALMRTREAFRDLDQSEPSVGLSSILMHEAAQAVVKQPSLWARFSGLFQPVFMHPAASAMATLVVVAGVAGALYSRNGDMAQEPRAAAELSAYDSPNEVTLNDPATAPQALNAPSPIVGDKARAELAVGGEGRADDNGYRVGLADEFAQDAIEEAEDNRRSKVDEKKSAVAASAFKNESAGKGGFALDGESKPKPAEDSPDAWSDNKGSSRGYASPPPSQPGSAFGESAPTSKKKARKNAKPSPKKPLRRSAPTKTLETAEQPEGKALAWEVQKNNGLKAAAKDKRCRDAGRIANDILDKKPGYYKKNVKGSKAVSDCGRFVAIETKRRAKQRQKQAVRSRKKAAGSPKKAKAATEFDQATLD